MSDEKGRRKTLRPFATGHGGSGNRALPGSARGLLLRTIFALRRVPLGFRTENVLDHAAQGAALQISRPQPLAICAGLVIDDNRQRLRFRANERPSPA